MNSRTFYLLSLCLFCAVLIIIPFWAQYFQVTGVDGRVIEWLQVLAGFSALVIGGVTLYFVTIQLSKAEDQLTKANEQLVKADVQISLAHKQLELADAQLALARTDSAMLTLQLRASACAVIENELAILDMCLRLIDGPSISQLKGRFVRKREQPLAVSMWIGYIRQSADALQPKFDDLQSQITNNVEPSIAHLSKLMYSEREQFMARFAALAAYMRELKSTEAEDEYDAQYEEQARETAAKYYNDLIGIEAAYKQRLDDAKRVIEA